MSYKIKINGKVIDSAEAVEAAALALFKRDNPDMPADTAEALWKEAKMFNRQTFTDNIVIAYVVLEAMLEFSKMFEVICKVESSEKLAWWRK